MEGFKEKDRSVGCNFLHVLYNHRHFSLMLCGGFVRHTERFFCKLTAVSMKNDRSEIRNVIQHEKFKKQDHMNIATACN